MFKLNVHRIFMLVLVLAISVVLVGCASPAPAPISPTAQPTDPPPTPASQWEQVSQLQAPKSMRMAAFLDPDFGIIGGPDSPGIARITSDGGKTWTVAGNSSQCLFGLDVIDTMTMWECNASDLRVTTDGGKTWVDSPRGMGSPGCKISAVDAQTAWAVQPKQFIVTHDGGVTREPLTLPGSLTSKQVAAISFRSLTDGYLLDADGKLYVTADGGQTWNDMPAPDFSQFGEMKLMVDNGQPYAAIRFFDADHGVLILSLGGGGASKVVALRTADGGQTWAVQDIPAQFGTPYLTHDGKYLTMVSVFSAQQLAIFRYVGE